MKKLFLAAILVCVVNVPAIASSANDIDKILDANVEAVYGRTLESQRACLVRVDKENTGTYTVNYRATLDGEPLWYGSPYPRQNQWSLDTQDSRLLYLTMSPNPQFIEYFFDPVSLKFKNVSYNGKDKCQLWTEAQTAAFHEIYRDKLNSLSWSRSIGLYSNGCVDAQGKWDDKKCTFEMNLKNEPHVKVNDSDAAKACRSIGARLPTKNEFDGLIYQFDHLDTYDGPELTTKGQIDMDAVFADMHPSGNFWTSLTVLDNFVNAYYFTSKNTMWYGNRQGKLNVRCVVEH